MGKASVEHIGSTPRILAITINIIIVWAPPETDPRRRSSALSGSDLRSHRRGVESDDREGKVGGAALCWERWEPAENMHFRVISPRGKGAGYLYTSYHQSLITDCLPRYLQLCLEGT